MPTSIGPNTFGEENLVFGFDTGDTVNSYKGEPTVNLFPDPTYTSTDGFIQNNTVYTRKPGQGYDGLDSVEGVVSSSYVSGQIERRWSINLSPGFYTHTFYVKKNCDFKRIEHLGTAQVTSGGSSQQQFSVDVNAGTVNPNSGFTDYDIQDYGDWWKVWYKIEISGSGNAIFDYEPYYEVGNRFEFCGSQIEAKTHPTPFTPDTRSATEGLIDLIGTSTIDLTNVSFDSNAQMTFDGTDDRVEDIGPVHSRLSSSATEVIFAAESLPSSGYAMVFGYKHVGGNYSKFTTAPVAITDAGKIFSSVITTTEIYRTVTSTTTISTGQYNHVVLNKDVGSGTLELYVNGNLESSVTFDTNTYAQWPSTGSYIGTDRLEIGGLTTTATWSKYLDGPVPTGKLYSRTLTASEIKANYNAIKGRFNI